MLVLAHQAVAGVSLPPLWRWSNPAPHGANIVDQAANSALTVQVGERGQIYLSDDWETWSPRDTYSTMALRGATFFGGRLVITGEAGTILFADDPWNFHGLTLATTDWLESVAASSNLVVAVGDNAAIYTSTNAVNWQRVATSFTNWLRSVACSGSTFVAVGERGLIASSQNGNSWQVRAGGMTTMNLNRVAWMGDHFLAVGDGGAAFSSANGNQWTAVSLGATNHLYAAAGVTNSQLAAGNLEVRLSDEGGAWSDQLASALAAPAPAWMYYSALWNSGYYLLAGRSGFAVEGSQDELDRTEEMGTAVAINPVLALVGDANADALRRGGRLRNHSQQSERGGLGSGTCALRGDQLGVAGRWRQFEPVAGSRHPGNGALGHQRISLERTFAQTNDQ